MAKSFPYRSRPLIPTSASINSNWFWGLFGKGFNVSDVYVPVRESDMILQLLVKTLALLVAVSLFCCILF